MNQLLLLILFLLTSFYSKGQKSYTGILIENITIISADERGVNSFSGFVLTNGDKIIYAGKNRPYLSGQYNTINGKGKFLIPGLIDSHIHAGRLIGLTDEQYDSIPELVEAQLKQEPKSYLYFGFTTIIDLGEWREKNQKRFESSPYHPNLFGVGKTIRQLDGYGQNFLPKPARYNFFSNWVYNPGQSDDLPIGTVLTEHTSDEAVKNAMKAGAIAIKTFYEDGGAAFKGLEVPSDSLLNSIVLAAHKQKLPVVLHANTLEAYQKGLKAGTDIFAHGLWHWGKNNFLDVTPPKEAQDVFEQIAKSGKYVQSTMRVILGESDVNTWSLMNSKDLKHALPQKVITWFASDTGKWGQRQQNELYNSIKPNKAINNQTYIDSLCIRITNTVALANRKGVKLIFGTDTPTPDNGLGSPVGLNGFLEMQAMAKAGVPLKEIFIAATYRNALAFGLNDMIGSVENGKQADLLILNANPLKNINAYNRIEYVISRGTIIKRELLSASHY